MTFSARLPVQDVNLFKQMLGQLNSTRLVHVNAISYMYKINIRGSILPWAGVYLAHINGQDQLARCDIMLQYFVDSRRLWPKMFQL